MLDWIPQGALRLSPGVEDELNQWRKMQINYEDWINWRKMQNKWTNSPGRPKAVPWGRRAGEEIKLVEEVLMRSLDEENTTNNNNEDSPSRLEEEELSDGDGK